jgi:hypothetical protein
MLPPRYRVRVKTTETIEEHPARTRKEAEAKFSEYCRWDAPENYLAIQLEDSGKERGEFRPVAWCDLTKQGYTR